MLRSIAVSFVLLGLTVSALAQTAPDTPTPQSAAKKAARPKAPKTESGARETGGSCGYGVISMIGDTFTVQEVGLTVFGNKYATIPSGSWGLDDVVVAKVRAGVPGTVVKRISYAKDAFAEFEKPALFRNGTAEFTKILREITASSRCERYVVVTKAISSYNGTNQTVKGVGIVNQSTFGSRTFLFALTSVIVYDGHDYSLIKRGSSGSKAFGDLIWRSSPVGGPSRKLENYAWPASPVAADTPAMRNAARALLAEGLAGLPELLAR